MIYTYADPTICDCLYVGNQVAYDHYRQDVFVKHVADEQQMTAQIQPDGLGAPGVRVGHDEGDSHASDMGIV